LFWLITDYLFRSNQEAIRNCLNAE
jgi:hypothetical protein